MCSHLEKKLQLLERRWGRQCRSFSDNQPSGELAGICFQGTVVMETTVSLAKRSDEASASTAKEQCFK